MASDGHHMPVAFEVHFVMRNLSLRASAFAIGILSIIGLDACVASRAVRPDQVGLLTDDELLYQFALELESTPEDLSNPSPLLRQISVEVEKRKAATTVEIQQLRRAAKYHEYGGNYIGMRVGVLTRLRGEPDGTANAGEVLRYIWEDFTLSTRKKRTRDYMCIKDGRVSGFHYTFCDDIDCRSRDEGSSC